MSPLFARASADPAPTRARLRARRLGLPVEMLLVTLVVALWELARIPLEGSLPLALGHARSWLALERTLHLNGEAGLIRLTHGADLASTAAWLYGNLDLAVLFAFMATAALVAPDRYPRLRTTFALMHLPALAVIGLYPLAPPRWLPALPFGSSPPAASLTATTSQLLENSTAAAASLHFGYAAFVAGGALWLAPRSRLAWSLLAYPALTLLVIVGSANHYFLDAIVGALSLALAALAARLLHRGVPVPRGRRAFPPARRAALAAGAVGLVAFAINDSVFRRVLPDRPSSSLFAFLLGALLAAAWLRVGASEGRRSAQRTRRPRGGDSRGEQAGSRDGRVPALNQGGRRVRR